MLMPSKVKYRKQQRGRMRGKALPRAARSRSATMGLQVLEPGWITARQIEAARIAMTRAVKRGGKIWIRIFPDKPYTKKPRGDPHGQGQGRARGVGRRRQAGPDPLRDGGRRRRHGARRRSSSRPTRSGSKTRFVTRESGDGDPMKKKERETLAQQGVDELVEKEKQLQEASWKLRLAEGHRAAGEPEPAAGPAARHRARQDVPPGAGARRRRDE